MKKQHPLILHTIQIIILTLFLFMAYLGYNKISDNTEIMMADLKGELIHSLEESLGYHIFYDEISPSLLTFIEIRNLRLVHPVSGEDLIQIRKLKIFYNPLQLLVKNNDRSIISSINLTGLHVSIRPEQDYMLINRLTGNDDRKSGKSPDNPLDLSHIFSGRIRIRSWSIDYLSQFDSFQFKGNTITLRQLDDYMRVKLNGDLNLNTRRPDIPVERLSFSVGITGSLQNNLSGFNLNGDFRDIDSNILEIERQRLNVRRTDKGFKFAKIQDNLPYDLNLTLSEEEILLDFSAEQFVPGSLMTLKGSLEETDPWLSTVLSGSAHLEKDRNTGGIKYSYDGSAYFRNQYMPFPVNALIDVEGNEFAFHSENLTASSGYGSLTYRGDWVFTEAYPGGSLEFYQIPVAEDLTIKGELILSERDDYFYINSRKMELSDGWDPGSLRVLVSRDSSSYVFSLRSDLNPDNDSLDQFLLNGEFSLVDGFKLQSSYRVNELSPDTVLHFLPSLREKLDQEFIRTVLVQSDGAIRMNNGDYTVRMNNFLAESSEGNRNLKCSAFLSPDELELYSLEMNWGQNYLLGALDTVFSGKKADIKARWNLNDNVYLVNGIYSKGQMSFLGNYGLKGQILKNSGSGFLATLETSDYPFSWEGQDFLSSLNIRGRYNTRDWEVYLKDTNIRWVNSEALKEPSLTLTAYLAPGVVNLFSLQYADFFSELSGSGSVFYDLNQDVFNASLTLAESESDTLPETYSLNYVYNDKNISSSLQFQNALMDRFTQSGLKGVMNADLTVEGTLDSPVIEGQILSESFEFNKNSMGLNGRFRVNTEKMEVYDLNVIRNNVTLSRGLGFFNFQDGTMMVTAGLSNAGKEETERTRKATIETGITLMADTGEKLGLRDLVKLKDRDFTGRLRVHPVKWNDLTTYPSTVIEFSREESILKGELLNDKAQSFVYNTETRDIEMHIGESFPLSLDLSGNLDSENLNLNLDHIVMDLNLINYFMPKDKALGYRYAIFRENSYLEGGLHIQGTSRNPDISGELNSRDLYVLTPYTEEDIDKTDLKIQFLGDRVETNDFTIPIGDGRLQCFGYMDLSGWGLSEYSLTAAAEGAKGAPFLYDAHGIRGEGSFSGKVRLYGTNRQGGLEGDLVINELVGSLGKKTEVKKSTKRKGSPRYPFLIDLEIVTGRNVQFLLPNPQLKIVEATAEQGEKINLNLDTSAGTFSMVGAVNIRNGEINYFDRSFRMTEGSVTFNENEDNFNPFLNLEAEIETTDINGDDVTVYLSYRNSVRDEFTPYLRTDPAKSEDQIMALFGQSLVPYESEDVDLASLVLATGGMVSDYGFAEPFENALKDSLKLDSVTIDTAILENAIVDQLSAYENYSGTESSYNLGRYLDNTSIYLGRFLGDYLFFSAGLLVDYDELSGINSYTGGMSLVPDIKLEMKTPFFLVSWNYNKDNSSDINNTDFVPRNAISLEWQFSY